MLSLESATESSQKFQCWVTLAQKRQLHPHWHIISLAPFGKSQLAVLLEHEHQLMHHEKRQLYMEHTQSLGPLTLPDVTTLLSLQNCY